PRCILLAPTAILGPHPGRGARRARSTREGYARPYLGEKAGEESAQGGWYRVREPAQRSIEGVEEHRGRELIPKKRTGSIRVAQGSLWVVSAQRPAWCRAGGDSSGIAHAVGPAPCVPIPCSPGSSATLEMPLGHRCRAPSAPAAGCLHRARDS